MGEQRKFKGDLRGQRESEGVKMGPVGVKWGT